VERSVVLTNLFNHRQTPIEDGWSVRRTQVQDFRGEDLTYDSHNGTDLAVPRGTLAVAPAPGRVVRVYREFNRGGLKIVIDHGAGLISCSAHLARALVREGQALAAGEPFAVTGYSGLDALVSLPWGVPHVHFNTWLNGRPVDPFAQGGETSLWIGGVPRPVPSGASSSGFDETCYSAQRIEAVLDSCRPSAPRALLSSMTPLWKQGGYLVAEMNYYPTRFALRHCLHDQVFPRLERLYLPFRQRDVDRAVFVDEL
jgi:murein DD-endopeptidase